MKIHIASRLLAFLICVILSCITPWFPGTAEGTETPSQENRTIVFTTIFTPDMSFFQKMSDIYKEAFRRLGYGFKLIYQPGERAMIDANQGIVDGEVWSIILRDVALNLTAVLALEVHTQKTEHRECVLRKRLRCVKLAS